MIGTGVTLTATLATKTYPWLRAKHDSRAVAKRVGARLFTAASIERSIRYYISPFCQSIDPAGGEESRLIHSVQAKLFDTLDNVLNPSSEGRYHILLADSGMGKTSALLNYYVRHTHRWIKKYKLAIVPLGIPNADEHIRRIKDKEETVLFLDALDEDTLAIVDHVERLRMILEVTSGFLRVLITCRTQFFAKDEEIPRETGVLKFGARKAGESAEYVFYKIYLTPFTDDQVSTYIKRRYPIWKINKRRQALKIVEKIPQLTARPMLLAHVDDLVNAKRDIHYSFELYEEMVEAWIKREQGFISESEQLREFSERLAVDLYVNRATRGAEFISKGELSGLAKAWDITIMDEKLSGRSLLNRDAEGNFKFAHRSIMEYLFVARFLKNEPGCFEAKWTDQMKTFVWEVCERDVKNDDELSIADRFRLVRSNLKNVPTLSLLVEILQHGLALEPKPWSLKFFPKSMTIIALCSLIIELSIGRGATTILWVGREVDRFGLGTGSSLPYKFFEGRGLGYRSSNMHPFLDSGTEMLITSGPAVMKRMPRILPAKDLDVKLQSERIIDSGTASDGRGPIIIVPVYYESKVNAVLTAESHGSNPFDQNLANMLFKILSSDRDRPWDFLLNLVYGRPTYESGKESQVTDPDLDPIHE